MPSRHEEAGMIAGVSKVLIEAEDQERAKRFWTETMGFDVVTDQPYGEDRWIELRSPDGHACLVLAKRYGPPPSAPPSLPTRS
jgi:lactoylglutathione lyase